MAETINGLYKAELIHRRGPWKRRESVEMATLGWVSWFNHYLPQKLRQTTTGKSTIRLHLRRDLNQTASAIPGAIHLYGLNGSLVRA